MEITSFTNWKTNTESVMKASISLVVAAMLLTAVLAVPAAAQKQVPFKGTMQGHDVDSPGPSEGTIVVTTTGTGIGTHLGDFSFTQVVTVTLAEFTDTGSAHWVAANGDNIDTTLAGSAELTATPGILLITEVHTVTGGTGRFASAQGSFVVERLASAVTFLTSGSFHGTITSPGGAKHQAPTPRNDAEKKVYKPASGEPRTEETGIADMKLLVALARSA